MFRMKRKVTITTVLAAMVYGGMSAAARGGRGTAPRVALQIEGVVARDGKLVLDTK